MAQDTSMNNLLQAISNAKALAETRPAGLAPAAVAAPVPLGRPDTITAKYIEVGLIVNAMLGASAASDYMARHDVSAKIAQRVLSTAGRRRRADTDASLS